MERTLVIIKPGDYWLEPIVLSFAGARRFKVVDRKEIVLKAQSVLDFYGETKVNTYPELTKYLCSGKSILLAIEGQRSIEIMQRFKQFVRWILRRRPPTDGVHAADCKEEALLQLEIFDRL